MNDQTHRMEKVRCTPGEEQVIEGDKYVCMHSEVSTSCEEYCAAAISFSACSGYYCQGSSTCLSTAVGCDTNVSQTVPQSPKLSLPDKSKLEKEAGECCYSDGCHCSKIIQFLKPR
jgi:hypothetical protein